MPQHKLETLLINRAPERPPRDPVPTKEAIAAGRADADPEGALHEADHAMEWVDDLVKDLPPIMSNGLPTDKEAMFKYAFTDPSVLHIIHKAIDDEAHTDPGKYIDLDAERQKLNALQQVLVNRKR